MVRILIAEKNANDGPINIKWPKTGFSGTLGASEFKTLGFLTKIEPTETEGAEAGLTEVSKLNFTLKWKHDVAVIA